MQQVEEGTGELEIYFDTEISEFDRITFVRVVTDHLRIKGALTSRNRFVCTVPNAGKR